MGYYLAMLCDLVTFTFGEKRLDLNGHNGNHSYGMLSA